MAYQFMRSEKGVELPLPCGLASRTPLLLVVANDPGGIPLLVEHESHSRVLNRPAHCGDVVRDGASAARLEISYSTQRDVGAPCQFRLAPVEPPPRCPTVFRRHKRTMRKKYGGVTKNC